MTVSNGELQKAGSAMQAEDYAAAQTLLNGTKARLQKVVPAVAGQAGAQIYETREVGGVIRKRSTRPSMTTSAHPVR